MNAYFEKNSSFNSNSRIIEAYFGESVRRSGRAQRVIEILLSMLSAMLSALVSTRAKCIYKALSVAITLVGFVGIIGAMENGTLGLGMGIFIGMLLIGVEYLCLRRPQQ